MWLLFKGPTGQWGTPGECVHNFKSHSLTDFRGGGVKEKGMKPINHKMAIISEYLAADCRHVCRRTRYNWYRTFTDYNWSVLLCLKTYKSWERIHYSWVSYFKKTKHHSPGLLWNLKNREHVMCVFENVWMLLIFSPITMYGTSKHDKLWWGIVKALCI